MPTRRAASSRTTNSAAKAPRTDTAPRTSSGPTRSRGSGARRRDTSSATPQPASLCLSPDGNDVGIDPHKRTFTASVLDRRGGVLATASFKVSGEGHRAMQTWVASFGPVRRFGVEGASGLGRHTAIYLIRAGQDVRDVCPNRTNERERGRRRGKSDAIDSVKIAREIQADPDVPVAFKRAGDDVGPQETTECLAVYHLGRRSLLKSRQHLLNEAEALLCALPEEIRAQLPDRPEVRPRLEALAEADRSVVTDRAGRLRLELLERHRLDIAELDRRERETTREIAELVRESGSTLSELCGIAERSAAELLVEVGDPRRFASAGAFARFNGTAPLAASSGEGDGEPVRHRLNRGGNRRVNAVLHLMAVTQLRCNPSAKLVYDNARARSHTKKEAMRILKRHLSDVVYKRMIADLDRRVAASAESSPQAA